MNEVHTRLKEHGVEVQLTPEGRDWLAKIGYDENFGARPLKRAIQKHVESPLSVKLLGGEFKDGETVYVDVNEDKTDLTFRSGAKTKSKAEKSTEKATEKVEEKEAELVEEKSKE